MTTATTRGRAPRRPLKSPLAVASAYAAPAATSTMDATVPALEGVVLNNREATLADFEDYLRTTNNRDGRPYGEGSINWASSSAAVLPAVCPRMRRLPSSLGRGS